MNSKETFPEQLKNHVNAWKASGKSCRQWAKDNNFSYSSLLYWRKKFSVDNPEETKAFIELRDQTQTSSGISLEIAGVILRVNSSFDHATLVACIELLRKL